MRHDPRNYYAKQKAELYVLKKWRVVKRICSFVTNNKKTALPCGKTPVFLYTFYKVAFWDKFVLTARGKVW